MTVRWQRYPRPAGTAPAGSGSPGEPYEAVNAEDSVTLTEGMLVRPSGTGRVVRALADAYADAGAIGALTSVSSAPGSVANVNTYGAFRVRFVASLTLTAGEIAWLSATEAGSATNVVPADGAVEDRLGRIVDTSTYAIDRLAVIAWDKGLTAA